MNELATREILWNVNSTLNIVTMYVVFGVSVIFSLAGLYRNFEMISGGHPSPGHTGNLFVRTVDFIRDVLFQRKTIKSRTPGIAHTFVYVGFLALLFATTVVFIENDLGIKIYHGNFYLFVTVISDILGAASLIGIAIFAHRRYIQKPDLVHSRSIDTWALIAFTLLIVQGFCLEGLRIHHGDISGNPDLWKNYSPIGLLFSKFFWGFSISATKTTHFWMWWFHALTLFYIIAILPYTKFLHIIASSANLFFRRNGRPTGALKSPGDLEKMMETGDEFTIGFGTIKDYGWKNLLDLDACTSCGRCQDACPAYISNKPLSPKWMILDTRNHAFALQAEGKLSKSKLPASLVKFDEFSIKNILLKKSGIVKGEAQDSGYNYVDGGSFRAKNELVQKSPIALGVNADQRISGEVMNSEVFWSCTTCMACVEACPVGINHVEQIVENRRNMVLMQGEVPAEAQKTLKALENRGNPYGPPEGRLEWMSGLEVPIVEPGASVDYLYWVGCVSAFDKRKQKIARSLVTIMKRAGLSFGVLGSAEGCSGDPARRLGEENLFQMLAKQNIETLKSVKFKYLVANCPHCFNTIKNEYPQFGNLGEGIQPEIIHHSVLLKRLLNEGKISIKDESVSKKVTFHDPCYLGRYNNEYEAPRETLKSIKSLQIVEMEKSKNKGMCCGAGGGHFWMDMKVGQRVNSIRTDQAAETGADMVATGCPFCMQMMEDGVKLTNREGAMEVKDIAELIAEGLDQ